MFDRTVIEEGDTHIDIKQLPHDTADAARLYGEMIKKAREEVKAEVVSKADAHITAVVIRTESQVSFDTGQQTVQVWFKLNNQMYDIKATVDPMLEASLKAVYAAIGYEIAAQVVSKLSRK